MSPIRKAPFVVMFQSDWRRPRFILLVLGRESGNDPLLYYIYTIQLVPIPGFIPSRLGHSLLIAPASRLSFQGRGGAEQRGARVALGRSAAAAAPASKKIASESTWEGVLV